MHRFDPLSVCAALALVGLGCEGEGPPPTGEDRPFRDAWQLEFAVPFPYDAEREDPGIERVSIGEAIAELGAVNRGDVLVEFDAAAGTIEVELRRFAFAGDSSAAEAAFARIGVVARDEEGHDCSQRWWDRCTLTLRHEGQSQPLRDGADIRIHLPPDYHHRISIEAHDVGEDSDYPDRGNVCLRGFAGQAEIGLDSGVAHVVLSDAATPAPSCSPARVQLCEDQAWNACGCAFGRLAIQTRGLGRTDVTVDVPPGLWGSAALTNPDTQGEPCSLGIDVPQVELGTVSPLHVQGEFAHPEGAPGSLQGYEIEVRSERCSDAEFVSGPDEFQAPRVERRGNLRVCSGCLGGDSCEQLLADR